MTWQQVHRLVSTVLSVSLLSIIPGICLNLGEHDTATPLWWNTVAGVVLVLVTVWVVSCAVRGSNPANAARALLGFMALLLATYPVVAMAAPVPGSTPWIAIVIPSAVGGSALAFPAAGAVAGTGVIVVLRIIAESFSTWPVSLGVHINDAAYAVVLMAAAVVGVEAAYSSARRVEVARWVSVDAYSEAAARRAEEREVLRWDSLVHDSVLSALSVGGRRSANRDRAQLAESRRLAQSALVRLVEDTQPADASTAQLVDRLCVEIRPETSGACLQAAEAAPGMMLPGDVVAALVDATAEAVRNALRHAGGSKPHERSDAPAIRVVTGRHLSEIEVTITDQGPGFDPGSIASDRMGLRLSVIGRMEAVGGFATVTTAVGSGTTVTLHWAADPEQSERRPPRLSVDPQVAREMSAAAREHSKTLAAATLVAGVFWLGLHGLLAVTTLHDTRAPAASMAALAICIGVGVFGMWPLIGRSGELSDPVAWAFCAVTVAVGLLVGPFVHPDAITGYANWTPGAVGLLVGVLVLRRHLLQGMVAAVGACLVIALPFVDGPGEGGDARVATITLLSVPPVAWFVACLCTRVILERSERAVANYLETEGDARVRAAEARSAVALAARRRAELADVAKPLLERLAGPEEQRDAEFEDACRAAELRLRDSMRARALLGDELRLLVTSARARGATVTLRDDRSGFRDPLPDSIKLVVAAALDATDDGELTVRLPPYGPTLTLVAVAERRAITQVSKAVVSAGHQLGLTVSVDAGDEDLLVEVT